MSTSVIYNKFRHENLRKFMNSLLGTDTLYFGIGRSLPWDVTNNSDSVIPQAHVNALDEGKDYEDMLSMKRVNSSDVAFGIEKLIWQAGYKYDTYRHDWDGVSRSSSYNSSLYPSSVATSKCTVITVNGNIYMCIKAPVVSGVVQISLYSPDTGIPVGSSTGIVKTADEYYWKLIGVTGFAQGQSFSSNSFHPISTLTTSPELTDPYYVQWQSQTTSASFKGGIYCINVTAGGVGYNGGVAGLSHVTNAETDTGFNVFGDGIGIQMNVSYSAVGTIIDVEVVNPGSGYTYAYIVPVGGTGAGFDIIFTPLSGLGVDPAKDVDSTYLLVTAFLDRSEGGIFTVANDFRKISLVSNPLLYGDGNIQATAPALDATISLTLNNVSGGDGAFTSDDIIISSGAARARVVDWILGSGGVGVLRVIKTRYDGYVNGQNASKQFVVGDTVSPVSPTGSGTIIGITPQGIKPHSGNVIYSEYLGPHVRGSDQQEYIRCVVHF